MPKRHAKRSRISEPTGAKSPADIRTLIIEDEEEREVPREESIPEVSKEMPLERITVVASGTTFNGDITADCHLEIAGTLLGSATAAGNIIASGEIEGNVSGNCILLKGCAVRGDVTAEGELTLGEKSIVIGSASGFDVAVGGKIYGDVRARGALVLREGAVVIGDAQGSTMTMQDGSAIFGRVDILSLRDRRLTKEKFEELFESRTQERRPASR